MLYYTMAPFEIVFFLKLFYKKLFFFSKNDKVFGKLFIKQLLLVTKTDLAFGKINIL